MTTAFPRQALLDALAAGLGRMPHAGGLRPDPFIDYLELLHRWNRAYNLSAVRDPADMVPRHLLDSLSVLPYLLPDSLLDVGSGAGLPGIPLAIARPDLDVVLLDSNGKKTRFMTQAALELGLNNVTVVHTRIQAYRPERKFATIISRAYARLDEFAAHVARLLTPDGQLLAMKGRFDAATEAPGLSPDVYQVIPLQVPGLEARRTLVRLAARRMSPSHLQA